MNSYCAQDKKTAVSITTHYEESRLMPSFSLCFRNKKEHYQYNGTGVEIGLNVTRQVPQVWKLVLKCIIFCF